LVNPLSAIAIGKKEDTMDYGLFALGALGALLTVYLAKQQVIPEFRPFFDTFEKQQEIAGNRDRIKKTQKHIDDLLVKLESEQLTNDGVTKLEAVLKTSQDGLRDEMTRLQSLEREIKQSQIISRGLGFLFYIVLGGVFGALLAGKVTVEGLTEGLPPYFQSIVIGGTWITYLSTIGIQAGKQKVDDTIEASKKETAEAIAELKKELMSKVEKIVAKAERAQKVDQPVLGPEVEKMLEEAIGKIDLTSQKNWDMTKQMIQRDVKGIL